MQKNVELQCRKDLAVFRNAVYLRSPMQTNVEFQFRKGLALFLNAVCLRSPKQKNIELQFRKGLPWSRDPDYLRSLMQQNERRAISVQEGLRLALACCLFALTYATKSASFSSGRAWPFFGFLSICAHPCKSTTKSILVPVGLGLSHWSHSIKAAAANLTRRLNNMRAPMKRR